MLRRDLLKAEHVVMVGECCANNTIRSRCHIMTLEAEGKRLLLQERVPQADIAVAMEKRSYERHGKELLAFYREPKLVFLSQGCLTAGTICVSGSINEKNFRILFSLRGGEAVPRALGAKEPFSPEEANAVGRALNLVYGDSSKVERMRVATP